MIHQTSRILSMDENITFRNFGNIIGCLKFKHSGPNWHTAAGMFVQPILFTTVINTINKTNHSLHTQHKKGCAHLSKELQFKRAKGPVQTKVENTVRKHEKRKRVPDKEQ